VRENKCTIVQLKLYCNHDYTLILRPLRRPSPMRSPKPCTIHREEQSIFNGPHFNKCSSEIFYYFTFHPAPTFRHFVVAYPLPTPHRHLSNFDRIVLGPCTRTAAVTSTILYNFRYKTLSGTSRVRNVRPT